jgi:hypothetical protein
MKAKHEEAWWRGLTGSTGAVLLSSLAELNEAVPVIVVVVLLLPALSTPPTNA